jgi:hypothetical protein
MTGSLTQRRETRLPRFLVHATGRRPRGERQTIPSFPGQGCRRPLAALSANDRDAVDHSLIDDRVSHSGCSSWLRGTADVRLAAISLSKELAMLVSQLLRDEGGFIVSAELVLVATILVIGMIVGLSEIQHAVVSELNDVGDAIGSVNQSFCFSGFHKRDYNGIHALTYGSGFRDTFDACDNNQCDLACDRPFPESPKGWGGGGWGGGWGGGYGGNCGGIGF